MITTQQFVHRIARWLLGSTNVKAEALAIIDNEDGMTSIEYALGALVATALAGALYFVASSGTVKDALESIITNALSNVPG